MEVRDRILGAAFDLFLEQGVSATKLEDICERADVANRTFFNHFPTRQDMMRALADVRLLNLHDVIFDRENEPIPARLIGLFDDIAATLNQSSDTYREVIGEMLASAGYGSSAASRCTPRSCNSSRTGWPAARSAQNPTPRRSPASPSAHCGCDRELDCGQDVFDRSGLHDLAVALADLLLSDAGLALRTRPSPTCVRRRPHA